MRLARLLPLLLVLTACGDDDRPAVDAGGLDAATSDAGMVDGGGTDAAVPDGGEADGGTDGGEPVDAGDSDAGESMDAGTDAGTDAGMATRRNVLPSSCPSGTTEPGLYRGTLADNLNDIGGACGVSGAGRDGSLRVAVPGGATLRVTYRHAGDGVLYVLDTCPVVGSCLVGRDATSSGAESVEWTNPSGAENEVFVVLDSFELGGAQTFELDLFVE